MILFSGLRAAALLGAFGLLGVCAVQGKADITFVSGVVSANAGGTPSYANAESLGGPYFATANDAPSGDAVSTTTASYSTGGFSYSLTESFTTPGDYTSGQASGLFYASPGTTYAITDNGPMLTGDPDPEYDEVYLVDVTTGDDLYDTYGDYSLTGEITNGDEYKFDAEAMIGAMTDPTLLDTPSITFGDAGTSVTPEPSSLLLLGTGLLGVVGVVRRRLV